MKTIFNLIKYLPIVAVFLLQACTDDAASLKQQMAELEKRIQKQEKDLREFAGKFAPPKDFSADIQRLEDQQDRIAQALKTKVDPVNGKLEEFRDWAQEAQKDRETVAKKLKTLEQSFVDAQKRLENEVKENAKVGKEVTANKKVLAGLAKTEEELNRGMAELKRELQENNDKIINAVKKTLPKVKEAAVAEVQGKFTAIEQQIGHLKSGAENDRKALASAIQNKPAAPENRPGDAQILVRRIRELEEVVAGQKQYLLEMGSKMHELETHMKRMSGVEESFPTMSRR